MKENYTSSLFLKSLACKSIEKSNHCTVVLTCKACGNRIRGESEEQILPSNIKKLNIDINYCPKNNPFCNRKFSKCSVCSEPIKVECVIEENKGSLISKKQLPKIKKEKENFHNCYIYCTKCSHGGHLEHYLEWFTEFIKCPNLGCDCNCECFY